MAGITCISVTLSEVEMHLFYSRMKIMVDIVGLPCPTQQAGTPLSLTE